MRITIVIIVICRSFRWPGFSSKCKNAESVHSEGMMQISSLLSIFPLVPKCQGIPVTDKSVNDKGLQAVLTVSMSCGYCQEGSECRWNSSKWP